MEHTAKARHGIDKLPPRIRKMRDAYFSAKPSLSIHSAKALTDIAREHPGMHPILTKARGIYRTCETLPIYISEGELIVGHAGGKPRAGMFSPDICWRWVERELDTVHKRSVDPYTISEEDKKTLREEIFPFWKGRSVDEVVYRQLDELGLLNISLGSGIIDCEVKTTNGGGDLSPGYANILLKKGYLGIKQEAEEKLRQLELHKSEDIEKHFFLTAVTIVCDAMILLGRRMSTLAREQAAASKDFKRKQDLVQIAEICTKVPGLPPETFHEALQALWFGQMSLYLEENNAGTSPGRIDQYLYPFLKKDLDDKTLTWEEAKELLYCLFIKLSENVWPLSEFGAYYFAGYMPFQNVIVGGLDRNGEDATNPLSFLVMECSANLKLYQPSISVRVSDKTKDDFLFAIADLVKAGMGFPGIHFDEIHFQMLQSRGISLEDARDYCVMACVEPHIHGKLVRWASAIYTNFPVAIELALNNGRHLKSNQVLGLRTGEVETFKSFDTFEHAVKEQLRHLFKVSATCTIVCQKAHQRYVPKPAGSALVEGCVESGRGYMDGGARYNSGPGVIVVGVADYANAMYAVKKLVFEEKKLTFRTLVNVLQANFEGHPDVHKMCRNVLKYGNDVEEVDHIAKEIVDFASYEITQHRGLFSTLELGTLSVSTNVPQGAAISALPSGRKAYMPLSDGISPSQGTDKEGPTSVIKSVARVNPIAMPLGTLLNVKIDPKLLENETGKRQFVSLVKSHKKLGGSQIQFNCVTKEQLLAAQKDPDQARSLIVRVAGYSAYFVELCKEVQDDIIHRTHYETW
ncbi:MAG: formate C-acetyltransferase/glycerol dehydratase family glycyl radical enzyme [Deltaproteobacteria bacterium]|nr:formate C-acetyltransferase/glycerol dehydratase family glycyl radical enzyme [Deltaproteobacteria bacterium]